MRLQRALAQAGVASRRAAERLIEEGRVRVDGQVATLGSKVDPERQAITVNGRRIRALLRRWLAFHKPLGVVTTASDEAGRRTVFDFIRDPAGLTYVGRLDVNTTGLLLLTNDGEAVHRLFALSAGPDRLHHPGRRNQKPAWDKRFEPGNQTSLGWRRNTRHRIQQHEKGSPDD